jgi:hypothetical protein
LTAIAEAENPVVVAVAQKVGCLIRAENGLKLAIRLIEQQKSHIYLKESESLTLKSSESHKSLLTLCSRCI